MDFPELLWGLAIGSEKAGKRRTREAEKRRSRKKQKQRPKQLDIKLGKNGVGRKAQTVAVLSPFSMMLAQNAEITGLNTPPSEPPAEQTRN